MFSKRNKSYSEIMTHDRLQVGLSQKWVFWENHCKINHFPWFPRGVPAASAGPRRAPASGPAGPSETIENPCKIKGKPVVRHIEFRAPLRHIDFAMRHMEMSPFGEGTKPFENNWFWSGRGGDVRLTFTRRQMTFTGSAKTLKPP